MPMFRVTLGDGGEIDLRAASMEAAVAEAEADGSEVRGCRPVDESMSPVVNHRPVAQARSDQPWGRNEYAVIRAAVTDAAVWVIVVMSLFSGAVSCFVASQQTNDADEAAGWAIAGLVLMAFWIAMVFRRPRPPKR